MKYTCSIFLIGILLFACSTTKQKSSVDPVNWEKRTLAYSLSDSLIGGTSYLSVYSEIYSKNERSTHNLTSTVSLRNANKKDSIFIEKAEYYNTNGHLIRSYFDKTIYILPMETVEIIIDEDDREGGTGGNFIFDWKINSTAEKPIFEAIMISTSGQQGLSFSTYGIHLK